MNLSDIILAIIGLGYVELVQEMVASDLADAKKHALFKQHGYKVNVSVE